jgi:hypothetical protein
MLDLINRASRRRRDDSGAVLVTVVVVMLVGFIVATVIASSVLFTITSNVDNRDRTQAFIAAESGRDSAVAALKDGCVAADMTGSGSDPVFTYSVRSIDGAQPTNYDDLVSTACPTADTDYLVVRSTGTGPDGSSSVIDSVYRWSASYSDVPGGVVTYFSGTTTQGVSHYTGDLVLRTGNWSCNVDGVLDGDLYVLNGSVTLSNNCTINGDIYAKGPVTSNSSGWHINQLVRGTTTSPGNITTDAYVTFAANTAESVAGAIHARGEVTLTAQAGKTATVGGTVTSMSTGTVDAGWSIGGPPVWGSTTPPPFVPTLDWLADASKWIDLDRTAAWGTRTTPPNCNVLTPSATDYVKPLLAAGTTPLVLDFTGCSKAVKVDLSSGTLTRDTVVLVPKGQSMTINLGSGFTASAAHQLLFVHEDANRDDMDASGDPKPTCGIGGQDQFDTTGAIDADIKVMIYTPCGLGGTVTASFEGQLYAEDTTHFHSGSNYTCRPMSWPPALPSLGCTIKGSGGVLEETAIVQELGTLVYQTER